MTVPLETAFAGHYAKEQRALPASGGGSGGGELVTGSYTFEFEGVGFALVGSASRTGDEDHVFNAELHVDGELVETATWPTAMTTRRLYLFWKYQLPKGEHTVEVRVLNPTDAARVVLNSIAVYDDTAPPG